MTEIPLMKSLLGLVGLRTTAKAGIAGAQARAVLFALGGGVTAPVGNYKDADKIGWHGLGMVQLALPALPLEIRVDGLYGRTTHKDISGTAVPGSTKPYGGAAERVYRNRPPRLLGPPFVRRIRAFHLPHEV